VSEAIQMRGDAVDVKRSRLWVARLKNSISVEQPIAGDELRALKRYLATREDNLAWLFISEREAQLTRQAVNYIVRVAAKRPSLAGSGRTCCATVAATTKPTGAPICAQCKVTSGIAIQSIRRTMRGLLATGSRDCGGSHRDTLFCSKRLRR
jgi:integrase